MSLRRLVLVPLAVAGALLAACLLYLAFGDLSRHKALVESLARESLGRPFAIDGAFELALLPTVSVVAERVRLGNAPGGSAPQMLEVGRFSARVPAWSLVFGPVDVRAAELRDATLVLERDARGRGNWSFGAAKASAPRAVGFEGIPVVVQDASVRNFRIVYRRAGAPDQVVQVDSLIVGAGPDGLLRTVGHGKLDAHAFSLQADVGPLPALFHGRDLRVALQATLGELRAELNGGIASLDPLRGPDLTLRASHPDVGVLLKTLRAPALAEGALTVNAQLKGAGARPALTAEVKLGEDEAHVEGTLQALRLEGAQLSVRAAIADAARVAAAFGLEEVPAAPLAIEGRISPGRGNVKLDGLELRIAGARAKLDGALRTAPEVGAALRFDAAAEDLSRLRPALPAVAASLSGVLDSDPASVALREVSGRMGESEFTGSATLARGESRRLDAEFASPRIDLTPLLAHGAGEAAPAAEKRRFLFDERPLPLPALARTDAGVRFRVSVLQLGKGSLREAAGTIKLEDGRLALELAALGGVSGKIRGAFRLAPQGTDAAQVGLELAAQGLRTGVSAGEAVSVEQVPPVDVEAKIESAGGTPRTLAAAATGQVKIRLGPGKVGGGSVEKLGSDLVSELTDRLNPFSRKDPYMQLECAAASAVLGGGKAKVEPFFVQSDKVAIGAGGTVDLRTEEIKFDFSARPRKGIGISAGMFTNPFVDVGGTLVRPRLGVGAKGLASGAAAWLTGGTSLIAQGLLDRLRGEEDLCKDAPPPATPPE